MIHTTNFPILSIVSRYVGSTSSTSTSTMGAIKLFKMFKASSKPKHPHADAARPSGTTTANPSSCGIQSTRELRKIFSKFDADGDGKISRGELESMLRAFGDHREEEAAAIMRVVDLDGDGCIQLEEFAEVVMEGETDEERCMEDLRRAFRVYDRNGDGKISARELRYVMRRMMREGTTMAECRKMIRAVDRNGDGVITFDEFVGMMTTPHSVA